MANNKIKEPNLELTHQAIAKYLKQNGFKTALAAFEKESGLTAKSSTDEIDVDLTELVQQWSLKDKQLQSSRANLSLLDRPLSKNLNPAVILTLESIHAVNILSVEYRNLPNRRLSTSGAAVTSSHIPTVITSAADKTVKFTNLETGEVYEVFSHHNAAVLCTDFHPRRSYLMLSGSLDGTAVLTDCLEREVLQTFSDQRRFVTRALFDPTGEYIAISSYDKCVCIYKADVVDKDHPAHRPNYTLLHKEKLDTNPETLLWLPDTSHVIVTCRNDNYIHYINMKDLKVTLYNMNPNGDDHVSFSALDSSLYPSNGTSYSTSLTSTLADASTPTGSVVQKDVPAVYLALLTSAPISAPNASSGGRLLLYELHSSKQVKTIYLTAPMDDYTTPRHTWVQDGKGAVITGDDGILRVVEIKSGKTMYELKAPIDKLSSDMAEFGMFAGGTVIKDVWSGVLNGQEIVMAVGYDKKVRVWEIARHGNAIGV